MRLWLLRHGETDSNRGGVFQGQLDIPLNDEGITQARLTAERLANVRFGRIYASDLSRAGETARIIAERQQVGVELDADLREMHYGVLQGLRYDLAAETLSAHGMADAIEGIRLLGASTRPPGGESVRVVRNRAVRFLRRVESDNQASHVSDILIVAHGGQLRILMTVLFELPLAARSAFAFANCGMSRVSTYQDRRVLDFHNLILWKDDGQPFTR